MNTTVSCTHSDFDGEILVEGYFEAGSPGRFSGPPEKCYPDEPAMFEIHKVFIGGYDGGDVLLLLKESVLDALEAQALEKCEQAAADARHEARIASKLDSLEKYERY